MSVSSTEVVENRRPSGNRPIKRELNLRFLLGSAGVAGIIVLAAYGLWTWQVSRTATVFLKRADQHEKESKWLDAAAYIERYLALVPTAGEERVHLAKVFAKGVENPQQRQRAIRLCYLALGAGIPDEEVSLRQQVGDLLLNEQRFIEAGAEAKKILEKSPADSAGLRIQALALLAQYQSGALAREPLDSIRLIDTFARARKANSGDIVLASLLADLYCPVTSKAATADLEIVEREIPDVSEKTRAELATACMAALIQSRPKDSQAYLSRFVFRKKWGFPGAKEDLQQAILLGPNDLLVLTVAAQEARNEGKAIIEAKGPREDANRQLEIAAKFYRQIIGQKLSQGSQFAHVALGEVLVDLGKKEEAIAAWQEGLRKFKKTSEVFHEHLADLYLELGELAAAEEALAALDEATPPQSQEGRLVFDRSQQLRRGFWRLKRGEAALAVGHLRQVNLRQEQIGGDSQQSTKAWLLLGSAYASLGEWVESATAFDRAGAQQPSLALAPLSASTSWLAANQVDHAVNRAEVAVRLQPTSQAWLTLARASLQQQLLLPAEERIVGRLEKAIAEATQRITDKSLNEPWRVHILHADYLTSKGADPASEDEGRRQAIAVLERAESEFPAVKELWQTLPLIYQRLGQVALADKSLQQFQQLPATAAEVPLIQARLLALREQYDLAEKTLAESLTSAAQSDPVVVLREQIGIKLARRDFPAARKLLLAMHEKFPRGISTLMQLAEVDLENGSPEALAEVAKNWEPKLAQCDGDGEALSRFIKIRRLLLQAKTAAAPQLALAADEHAKLISVRATWPQAVALGGLIEQRRGRLAEAISAYEQAISLGDQRLSVFEQLISLLEKTNRSADAAKYLTRMKPLAPLSLELTAAESTLEIRRNQPAQAVAAARRGVERRPQEAAAHVWLGRMLLFNKQQKEAEQEFEQAVKLQPDAVQPWNGLFAYYLQTKDLDKARETLARLDKNVKLPGDQRSYVLAQMYEQLGDDKQAAAHYQSAKLAASDNPAILVRLAGFYLSTDLEEAERCVTKALEIDPRSSEARRTLALILATRGKDEDWNKAAELLNAANPGELPAAQNSRLQAFLLAQRGGRNHLEQAIKILEELVARTDNSGIEDRLMLAQFYENMARICLDRQDTATAQIRTPEQYLALCRDQYIAICARSEPQAAHLVAFVEFLLRQNQKEDATTWLGKLSEVLAAAPTPALKSMAQCIQLKLAMGDSDGADKLLVSLEKSAPIALPTITLRARLMMEQGKSAEVEAYVEAAAERLLKEFQDNRRRAAAYQGLGNLYLSTKQLPSAEKWYRKLYELQSSQFDSLVGVLAQQGRISEALEICEKNDATTGPSAALVTISVLAGGKAVNAEIQRAERLITAALSRDIKDSRLRVDLGALRVQQGRTEEAVALFREAVNLDQRNVVALNNLATLLSERPDQRKEALKWIDQAIAISGTEPALFDTKATILIFEGRPKEAVDFLRAALDASDSDPRYRFHLALAYKDLNDLTQSKSELQLALQKDLAQQILTPTEQDLLTKLRTLFSL